MSKSASIIESIQKGPSFIESQLSAIALTLGYAKEEDNIGKESPYIVFLEVVNRMQIPKEECFIIPFLLGYLSFQAGEESSGQEKKERLLKQAVISYQSFLEKSKRVNPDWLYFAQWQIGSICQLLAYPWSAVEENYLKAAEWDPSRAEALRDILIYWCTHQEWRIAHIYSSFCADRYLGSRPTQRNWFVNDSFYDWKILKYHAHILIVLRKEKEAKRYMCRLMAQLDANPEKFSAKDFQDIQNLKNSLKEV